LDGSCEASSDEIIMGGKRDPNVFFDSGSLIPALKIGALSGSSGLVYGGISGVLRSNHPVIHSMSAGIHWFAFGSSFWWLRSNILRIQFDDNASPNERAYGSAIAGGLAGGGVTWALYRRFVPGVVVFSLLGYLGQRSYNAVDEWHLRNDKRPSKPLGQQIVESRLMPIRALSDEQYKKMLSEKLLSVDAEIALLDEKLEKLRELNPEQDTK